MSAWAYCEGCGIDIEREQYTREDCEQGRHECRMCTTVNPVQMTMGDWFDDRIEKMQVEIDELKMHCFGDRNSN